MLWKTVFAAILLVSGLGWAQGNRPSEKNYGPHGQLLSETGSGSRASLSLLPKRHWPEPQALWRLTSAELTLDLEIAGYQSLAGVDQGHGRVAVWIVENQLLTPLTYRAYPTTEFLSGVIWYKNSPHSLELRRDKGTLGAPFSGSFGPVGRATAVTLNLIEPREVIRSEPVNIAWSLYLQNTGMYLTRSELSLEGTKVQHLASKQSYYQSVFYRLEDSTIEVPLVSYFYDKYPNGGYIAPVVSIENDKIRTNIVGCSVANLSQVEQKVLPEDRGVLYRFFNSSRETLFGTVLFYSK